MFLFKDIIEAIKIFLKTLLFYKTLIKKKKLIFTSARLKKKKLFYFKIYNFYNYFFFNLFFLNTLTSLINFFKYIYFYLKLLKLKILKDGFLYIRGLFIIFWIDSLIIDDEPLWEPIEWSLIQSWILFIFIFAWIAENLITSRFGSYTGRDKRVWFAWYKTFWLLELWYLASFASASLFVIIPFYYELTYQTAFVMSWWNWYSKIFFFKFISIYSIILTFSYILLLNLRWFNWKKSFFIVSFIVFFLSYLVFVHFFTSFFAYFTDILWYQKNRVVDYVQLSHEPLKWGWGSSKRDHFTYHKTTTAFWYKNDFPFAGSFLLMHLFLNLILFFLLLFWIVLLRKIYTTNEVSYTYTTYCVSALKQFFYFFLLLYIFIFISFISSYWRFPIEFLWIINSNNWWWNFFLIIKDYFFFFY